MDHVLIGSKGLIRNRRRQVDFRRDNDRPPEKSVQSLHFYRFGRGGTRTATGIPRFVTTTRSNSLLRIRSSMLGHFALNSLGLTIRRAATSFRLVISDGRK
jgi:hypothetical protein